jgi:hypothetical protein
MQSQYGTSQALGIVQLRFTSGAGAFVIESAYGAVAVARQGAGIYQFQLNTGVDDNMLTPVVSQFNQVAQQMAVTFGNPTAPLGAGITTPANVVEIAFTGAADPASGTLMNIVFQTCFDVVDDAP